jgi:dTDP-4-amino-4,6-dideoxygalactose transaminase
MSIKWVCKKNIDLNSINNKITDCIETKHFTNNGKNVIELQQKLKNIFKIDDRKEVLLVCNGAMGINALVSGLNIYFNKELKWIVQSFTFPCSHQGPLIDSIIADIDTNMGPSIECLQNRIDDYDGVLITNCFGCSVNISLYEDFCKKNNKILLFDNAAASMTYYKNKNHLNYGNGCMVSLHHTKPIGFGEGGFIVFDKEYLDSMKKTICFGFSDINKLEYNKHASNYKMSEIACIYIENYLKNVDNIYYHHTKLINYFIDKINGENLNINLIKNYSKYGESLMACIPIIFNKEVNINIFIKNNIEAKKYYYPLDFKCENSVDLFSKIICLPLNIDLTENDINKYIEIIKSI